MAAIRRDITGLSTTLLGAYDDCPTGFPSADTQECSGVSSVALGFSINYFGTTYNSVFVNNNGNLTFTRSFGKFVPSALTDSGVPPIIAGFFADVDTRSSPSAQCAYGTGSIGGKAVFAATWDGVGYYGYADKLNYFQILIISRSDTGAGNFDIEFNYDAIQWQSTTSDEGMYPHVGYSAGSGATGTHYELAGSGVMDAFLDTNPSGLIHGQAGGSGVNGRYLFSVRSGTPVNLSGYLVTPPLATANAGAAAGPYTIALLDSMGQQTVAPSGGQAFTLSDGSGGGTFSPSSVTVAAGQNSATFSYTNAAPGSYALGIQPSGGALAGHPPQTVQAVINNAPIINLGAGGSKTMGGQIFQAASMEFAEAYLWGQVPGGGEIPFAQLTDWQWDDSRGLKEFMGPGQFTAVAVGQSERKITGKATVGTISLARLNLINGGSAATTLAAVASPTVAPTLTAGAGATPLTAGYVGVAYSYVTPYGETVISPVQTVQVTATQQIAVTALGALPSGVTSFNWYVTAQSYTTAPLAAAAALLLLTNNLGGAFNITVYPAAGAGSPPLISRVSTAGRILSSKSTDVPTPYKLHLAVPLDGSARELFFYNCVSPKFSEAVKLHEFTTQQFDFNVYGDPNTKTLFDQVERDVNVS